MPTKRGTKAQNTTDAVVKAQGTDVQGVSPPASHVTVKAEVHHPPEPEVNQPAEEWEVHQPATESEILPLVDSSSDSDEDTAPRQLPPRKKRKRELVTAEFTEEQEQGMVDWLQAPQQECLLNKKHANYIKKGLKDSLWDQKAAAMQKTTGQLKKWYSNMRSRFGKLKQMPSGTSELTARDKWILEKFEFLRPYLIVQVKKRVPISLKAKVHARAGLSTVAPLPPPVLHSNSIRSIQATSELHSCDRSLGISQNQPEILESDSDGEDQQPTQSEVEHSTQSRARSTKETRSSIAELQRQLLTKLSKSDKSPMDRQKDAFADLMKEVTYTFPPSMWLRFQGEAHSLLQRYQLELQQLHHHQQQQHHQQ